MDRHALTALAKYEVDKAKADHELILAQLIASQKRIKAARRMLDKAREGKH